jgi:DNA-binding NarL/FixJ family response regulator
MIPTKLHQTQKYDFLSQRLYALPRMVEKFDALTARQVAVMDCLACGYSNEEIADVLGLTRSTIKTYIETIYRITDTSNRVQLVIQWLKHRNLIVMADDLMAADKRAFQRGLTEHISSTRTLEDS